MTITSAYPDIKLYVAGIWRAAGDGRTADITNPATQEVISQLPIATTADLDEALASAKVGFEVWRNTDPVKRSVILHKAADIIRKRSEAIAAVLTLEQGKPLKDSVGEVMKAAELIEWGAHEGRRTYGRVIPSSGKLRLFTVQEPVGPVAAFSPWNFPAISPTRKLAGALSAGCSCILKASEEVPGTAVEIVRAFVEAGVPAGVINVVFGDPAHISEHLLSSPIIRKLTLTGSVPVGKHLASHAAKNMKLSTMELGGHSPVIVFDDVDVERVSLVTARAKFRNAGQICTAPTRFLVQKPIFDRFVNLFAEVSRSLVVGDGFDERTEMGPVLNERRLRAMEEFVADAVAKGSRLVSGGTRIGSRGSFFQPTVLVDVPLSARLMNEEPFGPIAIINKFDDTVDAINEANRLPYGLATYAFTNSMARSAAICRSVESGMIAVNGVTVSFPEAPFGGIKDSGYGREGGLEGIETYMTKKLIAEECAM